MKFLLTALLLTTTFLSTAHAGDAFGRITLTDGSTIFRISIGDERDQRPESLLKRVRNLEQAVGELQMKVYDLQREPVRNEKVVVVCSLTSDWDTQHIGQADTEIEAEAAARADCRQSQSAMFCKKAVRCTTKMIRL